MAIWLAVIDRVLEEHLVGVAIVGVAIVGIAVVDRVLDEHRGDN